MCTIGIDSVLSSLPEGFFKATDRVDQQWKEDFVRDIPPKNDLKNALFKGIFKVTQGEVPNNTSPIQENVSCIAD